jgi:hypothetical protein
MLTDLRPPGFSGKGAPERLNAAGHALANDGRSSAA